MAMGRATGRLGQDVVIAVRPWAKRQRGETSDKAAWGKVGCVATCFQRAVRLGEYAIIKWRVRPKCGAKIGVILFFLKKKKS